MPILLLLCDSQGPPVLSREEEVDREDTRRRNKHRKNRRNLPRSFLLVLDRFLFHLDPQAGRGQAAMSTSCSLLTWP